MTLTEEISCARSLPIAAPEETLKKSIQAIAQARHEMAVRKPFTDKEKQADAECYYGIAPENWQEPGSFLGGIIR
ncbi:MAG: hypothetical protein PHC61_04325 [Chitinivibrionales bacterium]|nr:hypothetical protein [Chitinivibrionales bacterium]